MQDLFISVFNESLTELNELMDMLSPANAFDIFRTASKDMVIARLKAVMVDCEDYDSMKQANIKSIEALGLLRAAPFTPLALSNLPAARQQEMFFEFCKAIAINIKPTYEEVLVERFSRNVTQKMAE